MLPNQEQVKSGIRSFILGAAGFVGGFGVGKGWYSAEQLSSFLSSELVLGAAGFLATLIYGLFMNRSTALLTAAAGVNPAATVVTTTAQAAASPAKNVVAAGSAEAKEAAR